jgi:hypothetical protein
MTIPRKDALLENDSSIQGEAAQEGSRFDYFRSVVLSIGCADG